MSQWDSQMEPCPTHVAERFSDQLADAVREFRATPNEQTRHALVCAFTVSPETVAEKLDQRRTRIHALLSDLESEYTRLGEDLGFARWRDEPVTRYRPVVLNIHRRIAKNTVKAASLLADLRALAGSPSGSASRDGRAPSGRGDLRPMRVPAYTTGAPGDETADLTGHAQPA